MQHRTGMQNRSRSRRATAVALSIALAASLCLVSPASAAGAPGSAGDHSPGTVSGLLASLWSGVAGLFAPPDAPAAPGSLFQASTNDDDSTDEDDCTTDGSCGFDGGGIGGAMDPNG